MAFDGSIVAALTAEFNKELTGGRISRIIQSEKDELLITVKKGDGLRRLLISVNPSLPVIYLTSENKQAPLTAPSFCMLLRKHLQGGKIMSITQPSMERIIDFEVEHYNDLGDLCAKILTVELMGKHSNIIFREGTRILDSIKHVSSLVSSVREVLPGKEYFIPFKGDKLCPHTASAEDFARVFTGADAASKVLYSGFTGLSPELSEEILYNAGFDSQRSAGSADTAEVQAVFASFKSTMRKIEEGCFAPNLVLESGMPSAFCPFKFNIYSDLETEYFTSTSGLLIAYYLRRQTAAGIRQKTSDLRHIVQTMLNRDYKKFELQKKQIQDTEKKEKFRVYGELLTSYGYDIEPKATSYKTVNFYTGEEITIPLDPALSAIDNAKKYFEKYSKLKRTAAALGKITEETQAQIEHLESIQTSLDSVKDEADIADIRREMSECGYIRSKGTGKKGIARNVKSSPLHFVSSDGFDIYVGKNNYQNDYITFKLADGGDWWFHAKKIPGSHVIVKNGGNEPPDRTFEEAASLAAHFSKAAGNDKAEVDYVRRKFVKKPNGAKPGFVIYHTNYSMMASTDISGIKEI